MRRLDVNKNKNAEKIALKTDFFFPNPNNVFYRTKKHSTLDKLEIVYIN